MYIANWGCRSNLLHSHSFQILCKLIGSCVLSPNLPYTNRYNTFKKESDSVLIILFLHNKALLFLFNNYFSFITSNQTIPNRSPYIYQQSITSSLIIDFITTFKRSAINYNSIPDIAVIV